MPFATLHRLSSSDLAAMASGVLESTVTDMDFLETLAAHSCFIAPPYVLASSKEGGLAKVTPLVYTTDGGLDKPRILLEMAKVIRRQKAEGLLKNRFSL